MTMATEHYLSSLITQQYFNNSNLTNFTSDSIPCQIYHGDETKCTVIIVVKRVAASLSVLGCLLVLAIIVLFRQYREMSQRMIANLAIACVIKAIVHVMGDFSYSSHTTCQIQGGLLTFFICVCIFWLFCIMFNLYLKVVFDIDIRKYEIVLTIACWLVPIIPMILGYAYDLYGPAGSWCWMKNSWGWRLGTVYFWKILLCVLYIFMVVNILITLRKQKTKHTESVNLAAIEADIRTLRAYPCIYFVLTFYSVIVRIQNAVTSNKEQAGYTFALHLLQNIGDPAYGAAIAFAYVVNRDTRKKLNWNGVRDAFHRHRRRAIQIQEYPMSQTMAPHNEH